MEREAIHRARTLKWNEHLFTPVNHYCYCCYYCCCYCYYCCCYYYYCCCCSRPRWWRWPQPKWRTWGRRGSWRWKRRSCTYLKGKRGYSVLLQALSESTFESYDSRTSLRVQTVLPIQNRRKTSQPGLQFCFSLCHLLVDWPSIFTRQDMHGPGEKASFQWRWSSIRTIYLKHILLWALCSSY